MDSERVGKFICMLRTKKGLTQEELANQICVTNKAVSRWERGVGLPDISLLEPLSKVLDVSVLELLNGEYSNQEDNAQKKDINLLLHTFALFNKQGKKHYLLLLLFGILLFMMILYLITDFQGFDNMTLFSLMNNFSIIPFINIISTIQSGNYMNLLRNIIVNFIIGSIIGIFCLNFKQKKQHLFRFLLLTNILLEILKWILLLAIFDIDDILIRFISGAVIVFVYKHFRKNKIASVIKI